jgi:hypothetical protein
MERGCLIGADRVTWEMRRPVGELKVVIKSASSHYGIFSSSLGQKYPKIVLSWRLCR